MFKVNNKNTRTRLLTSFVIIVNLKHISHFFLVVQLLTLIR